MKPSRCRGNVLRLYLLLILMASLLGFGYVYSLSDRIAILTDSLSILMPHSPEPPPAVERPGAAPVLIQVEEHDPRKAWSRGVAPEDFVR